MELKEISAQDNSSLFTVYIILRAASVWARNFGRSKRRPYAEEYSVGALLASPSLQLVLTCLITDFIFSTRATMIDPNTQFER